MTDTPITVKRPTIFKRWWFWCVVVLVSLFAAYAYLRLSVDWAYQREIARIRSEGFPVTVSELQAWYPQPKGPNAAPVYAEAFALFADDDDLIEGIPFVGSADAPERGADWPEEMLAGADAVLKANEAAMAKLREAQQIEGCRFPFDLGPNPMLYDPSHWNGFRFSCRLLGLRAELRAIRGDGAGAVDDLLAIIRHARRFESVPMVIARLIQLSIESTACRQVERVCAHVELTAEDAHSMQRAFDESPAVANPAQRVVAGERVAGLAMFDDPTQGVAILRAAGLAGIDRQHYLEHMRRFVAQLDEIWPDQRRPDIDAELQNTPRFAIMTRFLTPVAGSIITTEQRADLKRRTTIAGLAAYRFKLANGRWPNDVAELAPDFLDQTPMDPTVDQPLRLTRTDDKVIIYSLGLDRTDNGGVRKTDALREFADGTDVPFILPAK